MSNDPDPAKAKWLTIQAVRWIGLGLFIFGLAIYAGKIALPAEAGYALIAVGLLDTLFAPSILARMWKTPL